MSEHVLIFGKQIILWVVMLISPTPGSSGTAEAIFPAFFGSHLGRLHHYCKCAVEDVYLLSLLVFRSILLAQMDQQGVF
jgi:uncharacterized membrane protein YbhN (UPF0104 family)